MRGYEFPLIRRLGEATGSGNSPRMLPIAAEVNTILNESTARVCRRRTRAVLSNDFCLDLGKSGEAGFSSPVFPPVFVKIWAVSSKSGRFHIFGARFRIFGPVFTFLGPVLALFGSRFDTFRGPFWHFSGPVLALFREDSIWPGKPGNLGKRAPKVPRQAPRRPPRRVPWGSRKCQNGVSQKKREMRQTYGVSGGITFWEPFCLVVDQSGGEK